MTWTYECWVLPHKPGRPWCRNWRPQRYATKARAMKGWKVLVEREIEGRAAKHRLFRNGKLFMEADAKVSGPKDPGLPVYIR